MANGEIPESLEYKQQMDKIVDDVLAKIKKDEANNVKEATDNQWIKRHYYKTLTDAMLQMKSENRKIKKSCRRSTSYNTKCMEREILSKNDF